MFGDYGQNKDPVDDWDDDFESSNPAKKEEEVKPQNKEEKKPAFDDDYDDDFGEESEGAVHDSKKADFDDLAAGKKKTVEEGVADSSKNDIPSLPKSRKESSELDGESDGMELTEEEQAKMIEDQFMLIYMQDEQLQALIPGVDDLGLADKYQILQSYLAGGGIRGLLEDGLLGNMDDMLGDEEEEGIYEHNGKKFKRIQIEGEPHDFMMDEEGNIYDLEFNFVGQAGDDE